MPSSLLLKLSVLSLINPGSRRLPCRGGTVRARIRPRRIPILRARARSFGGKQPGRRRVAGIVAVVRVNRLIRAGWPPHRNAARGIERPAATGEGGAAKRHFA